MQEDSYRGDPNDPLSLNYYTYCNNNPLVYDDPTGHWPNWLDKAVSSVSSKVSDVVDSVKSAVSTAVTEVKSAVSAVSKVVDSGINYVKSEASSVANGISTNVSNISNSISKNSMVASLKQGFLDSAVNTKLKLVKSLHDDLIGTYVGSVKNYVVHNIGPQSLYFKGKEAYDFINSSNNEKAKSFGGYVEQSLEIVALDGIFRGVGSLSESVQGSSLFSKMMESPKKGNMRLDWGFGGDATELVSKANSTVVDEYGILKNDKSISGQAHHLNQNAAYRGVIPPEKGMSLKLEGNAFTQQGTPHYKAHTSMESFWNQFRRGGERYGEMPTNLEYSKGLLDSLRNTGYSTEEALDITRQAIKQIVEYGLYGGEPVPRIPGRINQVK